MESLDSPPRFSAARLFALRTLKELEPVTPTQLGIAIGALDHRASAHAAYYLNYFLKHDLAHRSASPLWGVEYSTSMKGEALLGQYNDGKLKVYISDKALETLHMIADRGPMTRTGVGEAFGYFGRTRAPAMGSKRIDELLVDGLIQKSAHKNPDNYREVYYEPTEKGWDYAVRSR